MLLFDEKIKDILIEQIKMLEKHFDADIIFYYGEIHPGYTKFFRDLIEKVKNTSESTSKRLVAILNTPGGSAETTEKMVEMIRFHYSEVYFVVPDYAMSAGTIFCMSGNKIFMDYSSSLGPIDPQIYNGKQYVPALGYLDKVNEIIGKSKVGDMTKAEFLLLQNIDMAMLSKCEQAKELTVTLLKKWLVEYKFQDWEQKETTKITVTPEMKESRASEIANDLGNNKRWHSHNRCIGVNTLQKDVKLKIEDYSNDESLRKVIRTYNDLLTQYISKNNYPFFLHSRNHF
jgi:membrane-bound ClpP family serine protease